MPRRALRIVGTDQVFEISRVTAINSDKADFVFHLDRLKDGTHRLTYNKALIPDWTKVQTLEFGLEMIRDDNDPNTVWVGEATTK